MSAIADEAALRVTAARSPKAVCIAPDGRVTVETPQWAMEGDIVGVYASDSRLDLWRLIRDDMEAHLYARPVAKRARREAA
ncbi:hypothetical protein [Pseudoxanthomonas koreensis]|uniref:hypothetical protein n=1 Tax=Pseudoxanthomonas koreensis TaxID=266061 RepID=UPI0013920D06|nr:hypothetical protein [Pseudoxanthomonas koreensis]